ncbi:MAG: membrane dipeptidase [Phycisphaeraceae bacterium]|nr:membrane dipeptidase [Phycisphaeraceae bacterium]
MPHPWFDAHLDLAYLAANGRDMTRGLNDCGGPHPPAAVTLPAMESGRVRACLATIFTEADGADASGYPAGDPTAANAAGLRQLRVYQSWQASGRIIPFEHRSVQHGIAAGILMECADPIRQPDELEWWASQGVVAIGLTWARGSRYASGNAAPSCDSPVGLTPLGVELVERMDALGVVHDVSHLSDRALDDVLSRTSRPVIASHSNCRALLDGVSQRHLTDEAIREIGRRGGVIGLNLVKNFIRTGLRRNDPGDRPSIEDCLRHVERVCELVGHDRAVGLGSDLDGGMSAHDLPAGINSPEGFERLAEGLSARGWSEERVHAFAWGNWDRFFRRRGTVEAPG